MSSPTVTSQFVRIVPNTGDHRRVEMDDFERTCLAVARYLFENFTTPQAHCWMQAFMEAERAFPAPFGATIAHAITVVVDTLRATRTSPFGFYRNDDPLADHAATREEGHFIATIQAMRRGAHGQVVTQALLLCDVGDTQPLLAAIERLCLITGDVKTPSYQG